MKAFSYIFVATILARLCSLLSFPVTARTLSVSDIGELTIWHSVRGLVLLACYMGLPDIVARYAGANRNRSAFAVAWRFSTAIACLMAIGLECVLYLAPDLVSVRYPRLLLMAAVVDIVPGLFIGSLAAMGRVRAYAFCIVVPALGSAVLAVVLVSPPFSLGMLGALCAHLGASAINAALCLWLLGKRDVGQGESQGETATLRVLLRQGIPILGVGLVGTALASIDRYAIRFLVSAEALGYYAVALQVAALLSFGGGAVRSSAIAKIIANVHDRPLIVGYFGHYIVCGAMFAGVLALTSPEIILILAGARYQTYLYIVPALCMATLALEAYSFWQSVAVAEGRSHQAFLAIVAGAVCALLAVPSGTFVGGVMGTGMGLLAAYAVAWFKVGGGLSGRQALALLAVALLMLVLSVHFMDTDNVRSLWSQLARYALALTTAGVGLHQLRALGMVTAPCVYQPERQRCPD